MGRVPTDTSVCPAPNPWAEVRAYFRPFFAWRDAQRREAAARTERVVRDAEEYGVPGDQVRRAGG